MALPGSALAAPAAVVPNGGGGSRSRMTTTSGTTSGMTLLLNGDVYAPEHLGHQHILIVGVGSGWVGVGEGWVVRGQLSRQRGFDFFDARQVRVQRHRERPHQLILRHADRLVDARERVLSHQPVLRPAEEQANCWAVVCSLHLGIDGAQVEIQLPCMFRLERARLELHHDVTLEPRVVEEQVDEEFVASHFEPHLASQEREPRTQLKEEARDMAHQRELDVALVGLFAESEKVEVVRILEDLRCHRGVLSGSRCAKLVTAAPWRRWS